MSHPTSSEVRFLLDENISPNIVPRLWESGIDALPLRNRAKLQISDHKLVQYAMKENRAVATINEVDFTKIVSRMPTHPGIAVIPSGGSRDEQYEYLMAIAATLCVTPNAMNAIRDRIVSVDEQLSVNSRLVRSEQRSISLVRPSTRA